MRDRNIAAKRSIERGAPRPDSAGHEAAPDLTRMKGGRMQRVIATPPTPDVRSSILVGRRPNISSLVAAVDGRPAITEPELGRRTSAAGPAVLNREKTAGPITASCHAALRRGAKALRDGAKADCAPYQQSTTARRQRHSPWPQALRLPESTTGSASSHTGLACNRRTGLLVFFPRRCGEGAHPPLYNGGRLPQMRRFATTWQTEAPRRFVVVT